MGRLTKRQREFINEYRECGGNMPVVAERMGVTIARLYKIKNVVNVKNELERTTELVREQIQASSTGALAVLQGMLANDSTPAKVRANIAQDLLDRAGLSAPKTPAIQVNINTSISDRARELLAVRLSEPTIDVECSEVIEPASTDEGQGEV